MSFNVWCSLSATIVLLAFACVFFAKKSLKFRRELVAIQDLRKTNLLNDLELATSDQLLQELRNRPGSPYLMLVPIYDADTQGLSMEIHNVSPPQCLILLKVAASLTFSELKKRGIDIPDFPMDSSEEGEEWKS